jgi:antitoxin (DNA-binding transcriptional repressor) of toxin-antitoxin stability system
MLSVNMFEAKSQLSKLVEAIELKYEQEIIIARHGRPVAKLVALDTPSSMKRIGIAKGVFNVPDDIDQHNQEVAALFFGTAL